MAKVTFNTPYDRRRSDPEVNNGPLITEQAGYIPPQQQIEAMIAAGIRLEEFRKGQSYDMGPDDPIDEDYEDVTRRPGVDPADISQLQQSLRATVQAKQNARKRRAKEESNAKSEDNDRSDPKPDSKRSSGDITSDLGVKNP